MNGLALEFIPDSEVLDGVEAQPAAAFDATGSAALRADVSDPASRVPDAIWRSATGNSR